MLGARLDLPSDGKPQAFALFAHCFSCNKNLKSVGHISDALTRGGIENAGEIYAKARHPKSFVSLDHADHLLTNEDDAHYVGTAINAWAQKYAGLEHPEVPDTADDGVVVHTGAVGYKTEVRKGKHGYVADEPISAGGTGLGPSPYNYLMAALGSCTSMTLRMYADRKEWPLTGITVRLNHGKIHATDCEACETESGKIDFIEREIELEGDLTDEQRIRLLEIADRCPVHRTLHGEVNVVTRLTDA